MSDKKKVLRVTFHRADNHSTAGDGLDLPLGAEIDSVEHTSMGEYVNVTYHVAQEVEVDDEAEAANDGG